MDMKLVTFLVKLILLELEVSKAIDIPFIVLLIIFLVIIHAFTSLYLYLIS